LATQGIAVVENLYLVIANNTFVMPDLVLNIHEFPLSAQSWMAATSPATN
jgi:hypothetical protein